MTVTEELNKLTPGRPAGCPPWCQTLDHAQGEERHWAHVVVDCSYHPSAEGEDRWDGVDIMLEQPKFLLEPYILLEGHHDDGTSLEAAAAATRLTLAEAQYLGEQLLRLVAAGRGGHDPAS